MAGSGKDLSRAMIPEQIPFSSLTENRESKGTDAA